MTARLVHLPSSRCGIDHDLDLSPLAYGAGDDPDHTLCLTCGREYVIEPDGTYVELAHTPTAAAPALCSHWAPLMNGTSHG